MLVDRLGHPLDKMLAANVAVGKSYGVMASSGAETYKVCADPIRKR